MFVVSASLPLKANDYGVCPDPSVHFCRCSEESAEKFSIYRVDITEGKKFETYIRSFDNEEECNYQITRTPACR